METKPVPLPHKGKGSGRQHVVSRGQTPYPVGVSAPHKSCADGVLWRNKKCKCQRVRVN
jgi:hypothetical protein